MTISRDPDRIRVPVALKLVLLLGVAPVMNIGAVMLTLENDDVLKLEAARFEGRALGINSDFSVVEMKELHPICTYRPLILGKGEKTAAEFSICNFGSGFPNPELQFTTQVSLYSVSDVSHRTQNTAKTESLMHELSSLFTGYGLLLSGAHICAQTGKRFIIELREMMPLRW